MIYGSVCSGIEAASVALNPLGWSAAFLSEIEAFPRAVLRHHFPETPLHGDFTTIQAGQFEPIDVLIAGTPCQSFSIAGLRGGMADARGNLALEYLRLADRLRPRWLLWENVPGVISSTSHDAPDPCKPPDDMEEGAEWVGEDEYDADESHAFACFLAGLSELGYGWAYRNLDAQYFGLAQRRKRVFVVGYLGDWRRAAAVLFESASLRGSPKPRRKAGESVAPTISSRPTGGGGLGTDFDLDGGLIAAIQERALCENSDAGPDGIGVRTDGPAYTLEARSIPQAVAYGGFVPGLATTLRARDGAKGVDSDCTDTLLAFGGNNTSGPIDIATACRATHTASGHQDFESETFIAYRTSPNVGVWDTGDRVDALTTGTDRTSHLIGFAQNQRNEVRLMEVAGALASKPGMKQQTYAHVGPGVRRLTPLECERLQGFPDGFTKIPIRVRKHPPSAAQLAKYGDLYSQNADGTWTQYAKDGPRCRAIGNSFAVPVIRWIGRRMEKEDRRHANGK